jgi:type IV secretory pathway VirD2 relaxase
MKTEYYELHARFDNRKSFYGKARVISTLRYDKLQSYDTIVAIYDKELETLEILPNRIYAPKGKYSNTTSRHIREFARQNDFPSSVSYRVGTYNKQGENC